MLEVSAMVKTSEHHAELPIEFVSLQLLGPEEFGIKLFRV